MFSRKVVILSFFFQLVCALITAQQSFSVEQRDLQIGPLILLLQEPLYTDRFVVISHPYTNEGDPSNRFELLKLSSSGELSATGKIFDMGRGTCGDVVFTPNGKVGIVAQDDGTLGVFRIDSAGNPHVVHNAFTGSFYAGSLMMHPSGDYFYVLSPQWTEQGGGVYKVEIDRNGILTDKGRIFSATTPLVFDALPDSDGKVIIAAKELLGSVAADDVHLISIEPQSTRFGSADPFNDDNQLISSVKVTRDGKYALVGDTSTFSGIPNRVAVLKIDETSITYLHMITPLNDPERILVSPFDNSAIVISTNDNEIYILSYNEGNTTSPFSFGGALTYLGNPPELPLCSVMIKQGDLTGYVLIAENYGVRMVLFSKDGGAKDLGLWKTGTDLGSIVGVIGVQP